MLATILWFSISKFVLETFALKITFRTELFFFRCGGAKNNLVLTMALDTN
jgi:hypothetical protein